MHRLMVLIALLAGCSDAAGPDPDLTYRATLFFDTYSPGAVRSGIEQPCGQSITMAIEDATMVLHADGSMTFDVEAWQAGGCGGGTVDLSRSLAGAWTAGPALELHVGGEAFAQAALGSTRLADAPAFQFSTVDPAVLGGEPVWSMFINARWQRE